MAREACAGETPIRARALRKSYGLLPVLRGVDLDVERGSFVALLGANGAGKSTLLRLLAGVTRASGGSLEILGTDCHPGRPEPAVLARIGFVAHEPLVYRDLTVRQNLAFFADLYGVGLDRADRAARVQAAIASVRLERNAERAARNLSRGTLQRLALARASLHGPELLLLDEPFAGLDVPGRERFAASLEKLHRAGTTLAMVSHDLGEVASLATRAIVLRDGRLVADLSPVPPLEELRARYRALVDDEPESSEEVGDVVDRP
jgi:ABC-2 type transport system ATP-binding protein/heme exporter protein A